MPKMILNEGATELVISVESYTPYDGNYPEWCNIHLKIKNSYIDFDSTSEYLDNSEVEWIKDYLYEMLYGGKVNENHIAFTEPEIHFKAEAPYDEYPGGNILYIKDGVCHVDLSLEITIDFPSNGCYCGEQWSILLDREEIEEFYKQWVMEMNLCKGVKKEEQAQVTHIEKVRNIPFSNEDEKKVNEIINQPEFKDNLDSMLSGKTYKCARATYSEDGGKLYTFFVDEFIEDTDWVVENTDKEVYVNEFCVLNEKDLPVPLERMKKIIPFTESLDDEKSKNNINHIYVDEIDCKIEIINGRAYISLVYPYTTYLNISNVKDIHDVENLNLKWLFSALYLEKVYTIDTLKYENILDIIYYQGMTIDDISFIMIDDDWDLFYFVLETTNLTDIYTVATRLISILQKYKGNTSIIIDEFNS